MKIFVAGGTTGAVHLPLVRAVHAWSSGDRYDVNALRSR
jgi:hypothetical protein